MWDLFADSFVYDCLTTSETKDSHLKGWFTDIGTPYLASGVVDDLPRKTLFAMLSFISGYLPSSKKPAYLGKQDLNNNFFW